ncbi:MAG TPA: YhcH/YjgK/YiaL family protein [Candidatus Synoicihabitans sp.]|nr:YhcH/YjgK/YiaL family protein [Candidatus Synoicihabitans sp.]
MALHGSVRTLRAQLAYPDHFAAAFHYLEQAFDPASAVHQRILTLPVGETQRVELPGGCFALEQVYRTKPRAEGRLEAHRKYVDLQALVQGGEWMRVIDATELKVEEDRLEERDVRFFFDAPEASDWRIRVGDVVVFFPIDAHMPSLALGDPAVVYKTVVKVPVPA